MNIEDLFETLTVGGLRRNTLGATVTASSDVSVELLKERGGKDTNGPYRQFFFDADSKYSPKVRIYTDKPVNSRSGAWVTCDCNDFKYRWEVVLTGRGSSKLSNADNVEPNVKNPKKVAGVCKHLYACLEYLRVEHGI